MDKSIAHVKIALLDAVGHGKLDTSTDVDRLAEILSPALNKMDLSARTELEIQRAAFDSERTQWQSERSSLIAQLRFAERSRERTEREAARDVGTSQPGPLEHPHGFYVYHLWSHSDGLLYVGLSTNILSRLGSHLVTPDRRRHIGRVTATEYPDRGAMVRAEEIAIRAHQPPWNRLGIVA